MASQSIRPGDTVTIGKVFKLDLRARKLRRNERALRLERLPMDLLLILVERAGEVVTREEIVERVWGPGIFLDTDASINSAIRKIRRAFQDDAEQSLYIQTVTGRGYRFIGAVTRPSEPPSAPPALPVMLAPKPASSDPVPSPVRRSGVAGRQVRIGVAVAAALLVLLTAAWLLKSYGAPGTAPAKVMLAVLPFENLTGDAAQDYVTDGITEEMIARIGTLDPPHLGVIARTSVMSYKGARKSIAEIRRELGVQYVLEGSVRRDRDNVRITTQLIKARDQTPLWSYEYDRKLQNLLLVQAEISRNVGQQIQPLLSGGKPARRPESQAGSITSFEAYDLYLRGRFHWNKRSPDGFRQAIACFQRATELDPAFAPAYAGLADSYALMSTYNYGRSSESIPQARAAALRALQLDGNLADAHASLALIAEISDWDWQAAEREFRQAIELNSNYATAHHWYAEFLALQGRFSEALAESERARQLDPLSVIIAVDRGAILYYSRQPQRAVEQLNTALEMQPDSYRAKGLLARSYAELGRYDEALRTIDDFGPADPWAPALRAQVLSRMGDHAAAQRLLAESEKRMRSSHIDPTRMLALTHASLGNASEALSLLEHAYRDRSDLVTTLKVDPAFDPIRSDRRFQQLLQRVRLD